MRRWIFILIGTAMGAFAVDTGAITIPSSPRSREAIDRIRPSLEKSLMNNGFEWGAPVFIRIFKGQKSLEIWLYDDQRFRRFKRFEICTYGGKGLGHKRVVGDGFAPEGFYYVTPRQLNPFSRFHLAFNLGYPNAYDRRHGHTGSALMVHGACVSIGCFAMRDAQMEIIYALADAAFRAGQVYFKVHIFPFPMTQQSLALHCRVAKDLAPQSGCQWRDFWLNLKEGYDYFERHRRPPDVQVVQGRYVFGQEDG